MPDGRTGYVWHESFADRLFSVGSGTSNVTSIESPMDFFERLSSRRYQGLREFRGVTRRNIYEEYAME